MPKNPLDRAAIVVIAILLFIIAAVIIRGDQVGVQIISQVPRGDAVGVATRTQLAFTFSEPLPGSALDGRVMVSPGLTGTLRFNGSTAFFAPSRPFQPDTQYTVTVLAGARSERGRAMLRDATWTFRTGHPRVVYLSPATATGDLYLRDIGQAALPQRITSEPYGVFDFAISPDGKRIVYSATRDSSGSRDLWSIAPNGSNRERIQACDEQVCQTPSFSADSTRVAFERRNLVKGAIGKSPGPARIWLYDFTSKTAASLSSDSQELGNMPRWAPVGEKLSYYDPVNSAVTVIDVSSGDRVQLPSVLGDSGTWSPSGNGLIYPELRAVDAGQFNQLLRADLVSAIITPVMPLSTTNDASVAWSPVGSLIAFSRQRISSSGATGGFMGFGPQVWVSTPDGAEAHALTDDPGYTYGGLAWSPDGEWIVAVRNDLQMPNPKPEVWLVRSNGSQVARLAEDATLPAWLP